MDTFELVQRLSVALAIGLIIGLERGVGRREKSPRASARRGLERMLWGRFGGVWARLRTRWVMAVR